MNTKHSQSSKLYYNCLQRQRKQQQQQQHLCERVKHHIRKHIST